MTNQSQLERQELSKYLEQLRSQTQNSYDQQLLTKLTNLVNQPSYGLVWEEHLEPAETLLDQSIPVLTEVVEQSIIADAGQKFNFLIEGENLHALQLLSQTHANKVDLIYIDPPYNTGSRDFIYKDSYVETADTYAHSAWLSFMHKRLKIAHTLLKDSGFICISIDANEVNQLVLLCDAIFGESNKLAQITIINNLKGRSDDKYFATCNEFLVVYAKNLSQVHIAGIRLTEEEIDNEYSEIDQFGYYKLIGLRKTGTGWQREQRPFMYYPILYKDQKFCAITRNELTKIYDPASKTFDDAYVEQLVASYQTQGYQVYLPLDKKGAKGRWRWGYDTYVKEIALESLALNKSNTICSKLRATLNDGNLRLKTNKTVWYKSSYDNGSAGTHLKSLVGNKLFTYPKSLIYIMDILRLHENPQAVVLDFFAGSGTTGHAVQQLNREDGGERTYILCTNNENHICQEVTYKRLSTIQAELAHNLKYLRIDYVPRESAQ